MATTNVLFAGVGGQGIILASKILTTCAFLSGFRVKESELHGMAQRGGSVTSHVRFGDEVHSPLIPVGKADFLVALEELEGLRYAYYLKPDATVILNRKRVIPPHLNPSVGGYPDDVEAQLRAMNVHLQTVKAVEIANEMGNPKLENIIVMGVLSRYLPFIQSVWESVIKESVPVKTVDINLMAFRRGRELTGSKGP